MTETTIKEATRLKDECLEGRARYATSKVETILTPMGNVSKLEHYCPFAEFKTFTPYCRYRNKNKCEYKFEEKK
jgi:hypothetical protein